MKALTLWQPWASLVACGAKRYETRGWSTKYRGPLLICAAKRPMDEWTRQLFASAPFRRALEREYPMQFGVALCVANLTACLPTESAAFLDEVSEDDLLFGNFTDGRFAWRLENVQRFPTPFAIRGRQGLFDLMPDEIAAVRAQQSDAAVGAKP